MFQLIAVDSYSENLFCCLIESFLLLIMIHSNSGITRVKERIGFSSDVLSEMSHPCGY